MSFVYRGLKDRLERHIVESTEVERQLQRLQQQTPRIAVVKDRPTQQGDEVVLDYAGFCGEEQFAGGTAQNQTLVLGSGTFIPGFEEQLLDKVPEEKVVVKVRFPEQYHSAELAGKDAEFHCVIHEIRLKSAYELDDVFAKEVGGCDTLDEMREKLRESMQAFSDERGEMDLQDRLIRQAAATLETSFTDEAVEKALDEQIDILRAQLGQQGLSLEMYCQFMNTNEAQLREDARATAIENLQVQAAIREIVELEKLQAEQEEVDQACAVICRQNRITMDQLTQHWNDEFEEAVVRSVLMSKAMRVVRDSAEITLA